MIVLHPPRFVIIIDFGVNGYDVGDDQAVRGPRSN